MKLIKCLFCMAVYSTSMNLNSVLAADIETPHSFTRFVSKDFCGGLAKDNFTHLNELTAPDVKEIEELKKSINDLDARKKIIEDLKNIRNDYLATLSSMNSGGAEKIKNDVKIANVEKFKGLLRNAMTLNAISLLTKNNLLSKIITPNIESLCESDSSISNLAICQTYDPKNLNWVTRNWRAAEITSIDKTLENFSKAMDQVSDKQSITAEVNDVMDSIPQKIDPQIILEVLASKAPNLSDVLFNAQSKLEVENCLKDNSKSCENLISDPAKREKLNMLLGKETEEVQADLGNRYGQVKSQISTKYTSSLSKILNSYDNPGDSLDENNRTILNDKTNKVLAYSEKLFRSAHPNAKPDEIPNAFTAINFSNEDYTNFKNDCLINDSLKGKELAAQIKTCDDHVKKLVEKIDNEKNSIVEQTDTLRAKLDKLLNHNPKLEKVEKLKQYIAQRFLRNCPQAKENDNELISNVLAIKCTMGATSGPVSNIQDLSSSFSHVLGRLQSGNTLSKTRGELGAFSKSEMAIYSEYCKGNNADAAVIETCKDIIKENNRLANTRDTKDWDDFNKKYWVEYSSKSSKGYDVYEKKSNARILGEGVSQSIGSIYPIWFGNFQLNNQIDMMTNQALYMKQLNYMNNPTSPWMLNNPYFQVNYFNTTGGFTGLGPTTATATTTTTTTTTPSVTGGFNFSK